MYTLALLPFVCLPWVPSSWEAQCQIERLGEWLLWVDERRGAHGWCDGEWDALEEEIRWLQGYYSLSWWYRHSEESRLWTLEKLTAHITEGQRRGWCVGLVPVSVPAVPRPPPTPTMERAG